MQINTFANIKNILTEPLHGLFLFRKMWQRMSEKQLENGGGGGGQNVQKR